MIVITINDEKAQVPVAISLSNMLEIQQVDHHSVALVLNGEVTPRQHWANIVCQDGDRLELFAVVAGG